MALTKNQHFVPQSYLRRFCDLDKKLCVVDLSSLKLFRTSTRNVAAQRFFYETDSLPPNAVENALNRWESEIPEILEKVITASSSRLKRRKPSYSLLTKKDRARLTWLVALQAFRIPTFRNRFVQNSRDPEAAHNYFLKCLVDPDENQPVLEYWNEHHLTVLSAPKGLEFWTSDVPVVCIYTEDKGNGLIGGRPTIHLPMDPKHMLLLSPKDPVKGIPMKRIEAPPDYVTFYNHQQAASAERYIFGRNDFGTEVEALVAANPEIANGHLQLEYRGAASHTPGFTLAPPKNRGRHE